MPASELIRPASAADAPSISALIDGALVDCRAADFDEEGWARMQAAIAPANVKARLESADYACWVALTDGQLTGVITLFQHAKIEQLFVAAECRHKGLASRLWATARAPVASSGCAPPRRGWVSTAGMGSSTMGRGRCLPASLSIPCVAPMHESLFRIFVS